MGKQNIILIQKITTILCFINIFIFLYFLFFGNQGGMFLVEMPHPYSDIVFFFAPIALTIIALTIFTFDLIANKIKNYYCFFITTLAYLPMAIFIVGSIYRPAH